MQRRNLTALLLLLVVVGAAGDGLRILRPRRGGGRRACKGRGDRGLRPEQGRPHGGRRQAHRPRDRDAVAMSSVESDVVVRGQVAADPAAAGGLLVRVSLPATELAQVDLSRPARVLAVFGSDGVVAPLVGDAASGSTLTYRLDGAGGVVHAGQRVRVRAGALRRRRAEDDPVLRGHLRRRGRDVDVHQRRPAHVRSRADHRGVGPG